MLSVACVLFVYCVLTSTGVVALLSGTQCAELNFSEAVRFNTIAGLVAD